MEGGEKRRKNHYALWVVHACESVCAGALVGSVCGYVGVRGQSIGTQGGWRVDSETSVGRSALKSESGSEISAPSVPFRRKSPHAPPPV